MSKAGANFGLDLLWTILLSCLITYYLILHFSKYTMVTGETFIQGVKKHLHPALAVGMIIPLSAVIIAALIGLLGIVTHVLEVWTESFLAKGISSNWWAILLTSILFFLIWIGNYKIFEKALALMVAIMGIAFIITMFINFPSLKELGRGFIPNVPKDAFGSDNSPMVIVAGMVGTTVSVFTMIIRTQVIKETGWQMKDMSIQKRDAIISAGMMFILSVAVLITASTTLHVQGLKMNHVAEMIPLLEPLAGKAAIIIFTFGILAAGISSHLPNILIIPWLIIDYREEKQNTQTARSRIIVFLLCIISVVGVAFNLRPVSLMLISQASIAIILPVSIASLFILTSTKSIMRSYSNRPVDYVLLGLIMLFALYMCSLGIKGVIADIINI